MLFIQKIETYKLYQLPVGLTVTGNPSLSIATKEQVASNPIPFTSSFEILFVTFCSRYLII